MTHRTVHNPQQKYDMWNTLAGALFDSNLITARLVLALAEFFWALLLLLPGDTLERPVYSNFRLLLPELVWVFIFFITGVLQMIVVLKGHFNTRFARYLASWNAFLWVFMAASVSMSVYPPPATAGSEIALAFLATWICIRPLILLNMHNHAIRSNRLQF